MSYSTLYVFVTDMSSPNTPTRVCTFHIGVNGNGSCYIDTRYGAIVPTITPGDSIVRVFTTAVPSTLADVVAYGYF